MFQAKAILVLVLLLGIPAALAQTTRPGPPAAGTRKTVGMRGMTFDPASVTIKVGDTIVWTNNDDRDHTVAGTGFKSDNIRPGGSYSYTFTKAGSFAYGCSYHPRMKGTVVVTDK